MSFFRKKGVEVSRGFKPSGCQVVTPGQSLKGSLDQNIIESVPSNITSSQGHRARFSQTEWAERRN